MTIRQVAVLGGGVIGAGWVARLIENGIDVAVFDPASDAERRLHESLANADAAYAKLFTAPRRSKGQARMAASVADACRDADLIVEAVPERLDIKHRVYAEAESTARPDVLIASSTSGIKPTDLQGPLRYPDRLLVVHPFNPVYLLPVVEVVGGERTSEDAMARADGLLSHPRHEARPRAQGDRGLRRRPPPGKPLARGAVAHQGRHLHHRGARRHRPLRLRPPLGAARRLRHLPRRRGRGGMRHFMAQFGPCLQWPWTKLMDVPDFDDALVDLIAGQSDAQSGHIPIRQLERIRDDNLVAIQKALQATNLGRGRALAQHEAPSAKAGAEPDWTHPPPPSSSASPRPGSTKRHMTDSRYLEAFAFGTDGFMRNGLPRRRRHRRRHPSSRPRTHIRPPGRSVPRRDHPASRTQVISAQA
jgi:carnitine 3-dehydrogenase